MIPLITFFFRTGECFFLSVRVCTDFYNSYTIGNLVVFVIDVCLLGGNAVYSSG
jgi:hypothetical protein